MYLYDIVNMSLISVKIKRNFVEVNSVSMDMIQRYDFGLFVPFMGMV